MLNKLWVLLEHEKEGMKLEDAVKRAGLEWYTEAGGGNDELVDFITRMKKYQSKRFIKKIMKDKRFQAKFVGSDDFYHLYLLRKTKHPAIDMLFGENSTFKLLNWQEMMAIRRRKDKLPTGIDLEDTE